MKKIIFSIIIIVLFLLFLFLWFIFSAPTKLYNLEYKVPLKVSVSTVQGDISYRDMGIRGKHENNWYAFEDCELIVEYFEEDVTNNSKLKLIKDKTETINSYKWFYSNNRYFTNYKGNTYVVTITNSNKCSKIYNDVIKSLKLK